MSYGLSVDELWALNINLYNKRSDFDAVKYGAAVYVPHQEEEPENTQQASMVASHLSQIGSSLSSENSTDAFSRLAKGATVIFRGSICRGVVRPYWPGSG